MSLYKGFLKQNIILNAVLVLKKWLDRECEKILKTSRVFWSKLRKSILMSWLSAWNLAFPAFIAPIVCYTCENLQLEYFN